MIRSLYSVKIKSNYFKEYYVLANGFDDAKNRVLEYIKHEASLNNGIIDLNGDLKINKTGEEDDILINEIRHLGDVIL